MEILEADKEEGLVVHKRTTEGSTGSLLAKRGLDGFKVVPRPECVSPEEAIPAAMVVIGP